MHKQFLLESLLGYLGVYLWIITRFKLEEQGVRMWWVALVRLSTEITQNLSLIFHNGRKNFLTNSITMQFLRILLQEVFIKLKIHFS
jgi:hypothetical protein